MVSGYAQGNHGLEDTENARHLEDPEVSISVRWTRTQKSSLVPLLFWIWLSSRISQRNDAFTEVEARLNGPCVIDVSVFVLCALRST